MQQIERGVEIAYFERLLEKRHRAALRRLELEGLASLSADEDDPTLGRVPLREANEVESLEAERSRDPDVGDDVRRMETLDDQLGGLDVVAGDHCPSLALQAKGQTFRDHHVIVQKKDELRFADF